MKTCRNESHREPKNAEIGPLDETENLLGVVLKMFLRLMPLATENALLI